MIMVGNYFMLSGLLVTGHFFPCAYFLCYEVALF